MKSQHFPEIAFSQKGVSHRLSVDLTFENKLARLALREFPERMPPVRNEGEKPVDRHESRGRDQRPPERRAPVYRAAEECPDDDADDGVEPTVFSQHPTIGETDYDEPGKDHEYSPDRHCPD